MHFPSRLLERPALETARLVAQVHLEALRNARSHLQDPDKAEALHDFRVALRRLRSWLRAFRPELEGAIRRGTRRKLRELAAHTGECRDLEVQADWVRHEAPRLDPPEHLGAAWLLEHLALRKRTADARLGRWLDREFSPLVARIKRRLASYRVPVALDRQLAPPASREVLRQRLALELATLRGELARVRTIADYTQAHRTRIAGKRLRYLLEPFLRELAGAPAVVARLESLQDMLGELHDARVFAAEVEAALDPSGTAELPGGADRRPGVRALAARLRARAEAAFARFREAWVPDAAASFFDQAGAIIAELARRPAAGVEIERKYLLRGLPEAARAVPAADIEQGWLPGETIVERLRRCREAGRLTLTRTIKAGTGLARFEAEEEIPGEVFDQLWPLTAGRRIRKRRYRIPVGDLAWEIDEFLDRELVLAEVELPEEGWAVALPEWLAPWVVREVTGEAAYVNRNLAR